MALRLMLPVVGCSVLYVLRFAGGPEGKMPRTFCWTTPVDESNYIRKEANMCWLHAVIKVRDVHKRPGMHCVCGEDLWRVLFVLKKIALKQLKKLQFTG